MPEVCSAPSTVRLRRGAARVTASASRPPGTASDVPGGRQARTFPQARVATGTESADDGTVSGLLSSARLCCWPARRERCQRGGVRPRHAVAVCSALRQHHVRRGLEVNGDWTAGTPFAKGFFFHDGGAASCGTSSTRAQLIISNGGFTGGSPNMHLCSTTVIMGDGYASTCPIPVAPLLTQQRTGAPWLHHGHGAGRCVRHPGRQGSTGPVERDARQAPSAGRGEGPEGPDQDSFPPDLLHPSDTVHRGHGPAAIAAMEAFPAG